MLLKQTQLQQIKSGEISLVFRKWSQPRVKEGSIIKTAVGQLEILNISNINKNQITAKDARLAGYAVLADLLKELESRSGNLYKIEVRYHSEDPRIALRNQTDISEPELKQIISKLEKFDKLSRQGPWVLSTLTAISEHPETRAVELSTILGKPKEWLKVNIRKLKNLGLTVSHETGYSLSPRGRAVLEKLRN